MKQKVPTLTQVEPDNLDRGTLEAEILSSEALNGPCYIDLTDVSEKDTKKTLEYILKILKKHDKDPQFPYPFYVITEFTHLESEITLVNSPNKIPAHFNKKVKRLKPKELRLLRKVRVLSERVQNAHPRQRVRELSAQVRDTKYLHALIKENRFYEKLLEKMNNPVKKV